ncbi:MAG: ribbon-helix-helix protein, CopG family [Gemmatimonadaceae bacterium]
MSRKPLHERIAITLPPETLRAADELAAQLDRSRSWIIAEAIRQFAASYAALSTNDGLKRLGDSRHAQLRRDVALAPESRVLESEELAAVGNTLGEPTVPLRFSTYDAFLAWRRQRESR